MKRVFVFAILLAAGIVGYQYYTTGKVDFKIPTFWKKAGPALPTKDKQGNPLVPCAKCSATGLVACTAPRCKSGKVPCPGKCLKESDFKEHWPEPLPGHSPDELWVIFRCSEGRTQGLSQAHRGEVAGVRNGEYYNEGGCPVCNGTSLVPCKICAGRASVPCPVCRGEKVVLDTRKPSVVSSQQTASSHVPKVEQATPASSPTVDVIRLKNGKTIRGTVVIRDDTVTWIRTEDGKRIEMKSRDILSY